MQNSLKQTQVIQSKIIKQLDDLPQNWKSIFTEFDDNCIRKYYPTKKTKDVARIIGKTDWQVKHRATYLGVKKEKL